MRPTCLLATLAFATVTVFGCSTESAGPTTYGDAAVLNKGGKGPGGGGGGGGGVKSECGGSTSLLDSRIDLVWQGVGVGIRSDGLGTYVDGNDGVHGKIFYHDLGCSRSLDAVFDPDFNSSSNPRKLVFHFPEESGLATGGVASGPFINFQGLMRLGSDINEAGVSDSRDAKVEEKNPGAARALEFPATVAFRPGYPDYGTAGTSGFRINTGIKGCEELEYDEIRFERTAGADGYQGVGSPDAGTFEYGQWSHEIMGEWTVESSDPHTARCFARQGNRLVQGPEMSMPFSVTITERRPEP